MATNPANDFERLAGKSPEEAAFFYTCGPIQVAERTWFVSRNAGVTAFETSDGLVLIDSGTRARGPGMAKELREHTQAPVHTVIYTHHHIDHAYGASHFLMPGQRRPRIIGQRAMTADFARYDRTPRHNTTINIRQGGRGLDYVLSGLGAFGTPDMPPDTLYDDGLVIDVGRLVLELHSARGETDDHTWVFSPQRGVLCSGDLMIWAGPNCGNPQKVQRYPWDWAKALREMAAKKPSALCPGHGAAVVDNPALIQRILLETAGYLDSIVEQTLALIERGSPPHVDIVRQVRLPRTDSPWLKPLHDDPEFVVRNVIRYYCGWWAGRPSDLKPAPRTDVAREIAGLAGGAGALAGRAKAIAQAGDLRLACHLADYALEADPTDPHVREIVAGLYEQRAASDTSMMAVNLFRTAASFARAGRPFV